MLNEERIKLMTKMASYEQNEGKRSMAIGSYFRSDYIGMQVMRSIISATAAYAILIGVLAFYHFESMMKDIYQMDLVAAGKRFLIAYVVFVGVYALITYLVYSYRYSRAKKSLKNYYARLTELGEFYNDMGRQG